MQQQTKWIAGGAVVAVALVGIGGAVVATGWVDDDETETPITGDALTRATEVALDHLGGGRVTGTEVGDEDSYYEVEVTLEDGSQVDVQLDEGFIVVSADGDVEDDGD